MSHRAGDAANALSLAITFSFVGAIFYKPAALFSRSYLANGFCVSFPDTVFNSHALCFYVDALFTLALGWLCWRHKTTASMARVRENYWGVLGHGFGHLGLYFQTRAAAAGEAVAAAERLAPLADSASLLHYAMWPVLFGFWLSFFFTLTPSKLFNAAFSLLNTVVLGAYVPRLYGFTYVQTVLMTVFVVRDLFDASRKDEWYNLWSWCVNGASADFLWQRV